MSTIKPFKSVRPASRYAKDIAALPYDVYSSREAREIVQKSPLSFLQVDRAESLFPEGTDPYSPPVYEKARDTLYEMLEKGLLIQDKNDFFYIYRLTMDGRSQTGLVACTAIDEYLNDTIKKHELTRPEKEQDRINHVDYCDANTGPIFLTYRAKEAVDNIINDWMMANTPVYDFVAEDGVKHQAWVVDHPDVIHDLQAAFNSVPALYIADGHHRAASAVKVGLKRREQFPDYSGNEEFNFFLSVIFPDDQLRIMDYNRVVKDLNGHSPDSFLQRVAERFTIEESGPQQIRPANKGSIAMFLGSTWYALKVKPGTYDAADPVRSLDVSILQENLLAPILGIEDPRTDERVDFIGGIRGLGELEKRVHEDMAVAFALYPTSVAELMSIADANKLMPPKSTWFEPKLRSGLFIHLLG